LGEQQQQGNNNNNNSHHHHHHHHHHHVHRLVNNSVSETDLTEAQRRATSVTSVTLW
jgi:hypothetical protein